MFFPVCKRTLPRTYRSTAMARKLKMEPTKDMHSRESMMSSSLIAETPFFFRWPTLAMAIMRFSTVLVELEMVLKAARLPMKQYMGMCRFLLHKMATTISRFSVRLTAPMVKKIGSGTLTSGQSV